MLTIKPTFIIYLVITLPIFADFASGLTGAFGVTIPSLSLIVRATIAFVGLALLVIHFRRPLSIYVGLLALLWLFCSLVWALNSSFYSGWLEFLGFFKSIYAFCVLGILFHLIQQGMPIKNATEKAIIAVSAFAGLAIIFSYVTGFGIATYGDYAFGTSSYFRSSNGLGITMLLGLTLALVRAVTLRSWRYLLVSLLIFGGLLPLGSLTGVFGALIVVTVYTTIYVGWRYPGNIVARLMRPVMIAVFLIGIPYVGMKMWGELSQYSYFTDKIARVVAEGPRARLIKISSEYIGGRSAVQQVFGAGFESYGDRFMVLDTLRPMMEGGLGHAEIDSLDIIGGYGLLLGGLLLSPYFLWLFGAARNWFAMPTIETFTIAFGILLAMGHALLAGHVLLNPVVMGSFAGFVALARINRREILARSSLSARSANSPQSGSTGR